MVATATGEAGLAVGSTLADNVGQMCAGDPNSRTALKIRKANAKKKSKSALRADLRVSTITIAYLVVRSPPRR